MQPLDKEYGSIYQYLLVYKLNQHRVYMHIYQNKLPMCTRSGWQDWYADIFKAPLSIARYTRIGSEAAVNTANLLAIKVVSSYRDGPAPQVSCVIHTPDNAIGRLGSIRQVNLQKFRLVRSHETSTRKRVWVL